MAVYTLYFGVERSLNRNILNRNARNAVAHFYLFIAIGQRSDTIKNTGYP